MSFRVVFEAAKIWKGAVITKNLFPIIKTKTGIKFLVKFTS